MVAEPCVPLSRHPPPDPHLPRSKGPRLTTPPGDAAMRTPGGDAVHAHREPVGHDTPAPRDEIRRRACEAHLRRFLGDEFTLLTEKVSMGIHLDVYVFPPSDEVPYVTLVSSGMSDLAMNKPPGYDGKHLELLIGVPAGWPGLDPLDGDLLAGPANFWPMKLLKDVARIPSTYDSFVDWGHTIRDDDGALFAPGLPFNGAIVGPPLGYPPNIMRATTPLGDVDYLAVFPATPEEMDFKIAIHGGGDALIDRYSEARVSAVVNPQRAGVVVGPPPWAVHLLMKHRPDNLGEVLDRAMPNLAVALRQKGVADEVVPVGEEKVRFRVSGPISPPDLIQHAERSAEPDHLRTAALDHRGVVSIFPERAGDGDQVSAVWAMASMLADRDDVAAVWLRHQQHLTTAAQFVKDANGEALLLFRIHPSAAPEGSTAVITRGLAALGGREVRLSNTGLTHEQLVKRAYAALNRAPGEADVVPKAGERLKYGFTSYELRESVDPVSQEPVLEMVEVPKEKWRLFGRKG